MVELAKPICPRCGYDLSGLVSSWQGCCPLEGCCSECGLTFGWAEVLCPSRRLLGFVEHARGVRQTFLWTISTFAWLVLPWRFWSRVKIVDSPALGPVFIGGVLVAMIVQIASRLLVCAMIVLGGGSAGSSPSFPMIASHSVLEYVGAFTMPFAYAEESTFVHSIVPFISAWIVKFLAIVAFMLGWPLLFCVLPATRKFGKVRWGHIWRATLYPFWWFVFILAADRLQRVIWSSLENLGGNVHWKLYLFDSFHYVSATVEMGLWFFLPMWLGCWWWQAIVRNWRVSRGNLLFILLLVASALWGCLVGVFAWWAEVFISSGA